MLYQHAAPHGDWRYGFEDLWGRCSDNMPPPMGLEGVVLRILEGSMFYSFPDNDFECVIGRRYTPV